MIATHHPASPIYIRNICIYIVAFVFFPSKGPTNCQCNTRTRGKGQGTEAARAAQSRVGQELGRRWQPIVPTLALRPCRLSLLFSPLESICSFALWWHYVCNFVHIFLGPASLSISPQTLLHHTALRKIAQKQAKPEPPSAVVQRIGM